MPDRCPDCGKTQWCEHPAVRPATEKEVADLLRARAEDEAELNLTACGLHQATGFSVQKERS